MPALWPQSETGSAKSTAIMALLKSGQADTNWTLPSRMANSGKWFFVDIRQMTREYILVVLRNTPVAEAC